MDRTWLFAVLTGHGQLVGDLAAAQQGGEEREHGELPLAQRCRNLRVHDMTACVSCWANCVPTPVAGEERRSSPVKPTAGARDERRRTNDADGLAKSERSAIAARPARVVGL